MANGGGEAATFGAGMAERDQGINDQDQGGGAARAPDRRKQLRRTLAQLGWVRLVLTLLSLAIAFAIARYSTGLPMLVDAERALYDMRATVGAPHVPQDSRIAMVTYTDEVLIETRVRSPLDRALLARALAVIDTMGPKSIGIDILFDQATDNDAALIAQLRSMRTPTYLAFAEPSSNPNDIQPVQADFLRGFIAQASGGHSHAASIRLSTDSDDSYRHWPGRVAGTPPLLAVAMASVGASPAAVRAANAFEAYRGAVRWRLPAQLTIADGGTEVTPVFERMPINNFTNPALLEPENRPFLESVVRGRHILIGGDISGIDEFDTPITRLPDPVTGEAKKMIGLEVHAHMLAQVLDNAMLFHMPVALIWLLAAMAVLAGILTALLDLRPIYSAALLVVQLAVIAIIPMVMQYYGVDTLSLPVAGGAVGWLIAFVATSSAVRAVNAEERAFAQSALGKYLPADIAREIIRDPDRLALHGEKKPIYCLFSDLEGFTKMSHQLTPEQVAFVLNDYLDTLSDVVLEHGGTIDKFVGDAVVAFWGAPIARRDDADKASAALAAMAAAGDAFSARMAGELGGSLPPIGRTRVGLHYGDAVVGNFGGDGRIQYTALGDSMNTAARLESANKQMQSGALASAEALANVTQGRDIYVPMGRVRLRGRARPVDVFTPRGDLPPAARDAIAALVAAHDGGKGDGYAAARDALTNMAIERRADIDFLIERLDATESGGVYELD